MQNSVIRHIQGWESPVSIESEQKHTWCSYTMEYYLALKMEEIQIHLLHKTHTGFRLHEAPHLQIQT